MERLTVPSGTVTLLFTDIEGSTRLLERLRDQFARLLEEHHAIVRKSLARWNGYEIGTQGDAFFATFASASDALACVIEVQREMAAHSWPDEATVRVRMGLHTGEPIVMGGHDYTGMDVHQAARIASSGHGGQVLLSQATRDLVYQNLPSGVAVEELGNFKLKDIREPQQLYQLDIEGLPSEFPALKTLSSKEEPPTAGEPPYKGLVNFEEQDASHFFGREAVTSQLLQNLLETRFLAVVGASGSGKSSVVRAGLVPALKAEKPGWLVRILTPGARPLETLAGHLDSLRKTPPTESVLESKLHQEPGSLHYYVRKNILPMVTPSEGDDDRTEVRLLLVIDQFEELFTMCRDEAERQAFIDNLIFACEHDAGLVAAVITLRADYYAYLAQYNNLRHLVARRQEYLGVMSTDELRQAIEQPARLGGWEFSPGLVDLMLYDVGASVGRQPEPGALPLLSHALLETWKRRRGVTMSLKSYAEAGGVRSAIARTADAVFYGEFSPEQQQSARSIFLRLAEFGEGAQDTRRRVELRELTQIGRQAGDARIEIVLNRLAEARLVTIAEGSVEVAHEALIREWPVLREWLTQDREGLRVHRNLTEAANEWRRMAGDLGQLYRGARLAQALEWAQANSSQLNLQEQEFLDASRLAIEQEQAEREAQRLRELEAAKTLAETERKAAAQLRKRAFYLVSALVAALVLAGAALYFGQNARRSSITAQNERRLAVTRELSAASINNLEIDPERSILLALQAVATTRDFDGTVLPEAEEALHRALLGSPVRQTLREHDDSVLTVDFSPDGKYLASLERDGTVIVRDARKGVEKMRFAGSTEVSDEFSAQRLTYSPDGSRLASGDGNEIKVRDAETGELLSTLSGHTGVVWSMAYSPDDQRIASGSADQTVRMWDAATGEQLQVLEGHTGSIEEVAFSPDGRWLASASDDATLKVWDALDGRLVIDQTGFPEIVSSAVFSSDGSLLAAASSDGVYIWRLMESSQAGGPGLGLQEILRIEETGGSLAFSPDGSQLAAMNGSTARLLDVKSGRELLSLAGHTDWVVDADFSPDGKQLATASFDGTVKVWDITPGKETVAVAGPGRQFSFVAFSPDGSKFATPGADGSVVIWDASSGVKLLTLAENNQQMMAIAYSPDGRRLAAAGFDARATIWDAETGQVLAVLQGHEIGIRDVAFSPDSQQVATAGFDQTARIWDAATGVELLKLTGFDSLVLGVAFSPDGKVLATSSTDQKVRLWEAVTGNLLRILEGNINPKDIAFSPAGGMLATGASEGAVILWDAVNGIPLRTLESPGSDIQSIAFSQDGRWIAIGSSDNTAKIWEAETGAEAHLIPGSLGGVVGVAFNPVYHGDRLSVASADGIVREFLLKINDLVALAETRLTRSLTAEECRKYLHLEQCPTGEN